MADRSATPSNSETESGDGGRVRMGTSSSLTCSDLKRRAELSLDLHRYRLKKRLTWTYVFRFLIGSFVDVKRCDIEFAATRDGVVGLVQVLS